MIRLAVPALLALAACTTTAAVSERRSDAERIDRALAGLKPGAPMRCLREDQSNGLRTFEGTILYVAGRGRIYRNDVVGICDGLRRGDIVVTMNHGTQSCDGDIVQTRARTGGQITGSCSLGKFIPYTR